MTFTYNFNFSKKLKWQFIGRFTYYYDIIFNELNILYEHNYNKDIQVNKIGIYFGSFGPNASRPYRSHAECL